MGLEGRERGAFALALAVGVGLLGLSGLAQLGTWEAGRVDSTPSSAALAIASFADGGTANTIAVATPEGAVAIYRNDQSIALVRGHGAAIVSAAFIEEGRALLTMDTAGQTRLTRLGTAQARSVFEVRPALAALDHGLWRPYGAPVARAVSGQGWNLGSNALIGALASVLLALGLFASPQVAAFAGRLQRRPGAPVAPEPTARFQPPRTPGAIWRDRHPGLPENALPEMVTLPPGRFRMGAAEGEKGASLDESPQHEVAINYAFALGKFTLTFAEWDAALAAGAKLSKPYDEGWGRGGRPVINVSWEDAQAYLAWLNEQLGLTGRPDAYRLPSEAEWEYACRAGSTTSWGFGDDEHQLGDYAWFGANSDGKTHPVGQKKPNAFGLHDMHGNVWEWCEDSFQNNYEGAPVDGSAWIGQKSSDRVVRGGSWGSVPQVLRSAGRIWYVPSNRGGLLGFRVARTL